MMFKSFVLGLLLWQQVVTDVFGQTQDGIVDTDVQGFAVSTDPKNSREVSTSHGSVTNFTADQQFFYFRDAFPREGLTGSSGGWRRVPTDYLVTPGLGAHKVHVRDLSWNAARKICIHEGGHLAVIRSISEEKIVQQLMRDVDVPDAFVGYHDLFEHGHWITVLDEPMGQTGWGRWAPSIRPNPDNANNNQHCARLLRDGGGLDDIECHGSRSFICKI